VEIENNKIDKIIKIKEYEFKIQAENKINKLKEINESKIDFIYKNYTRCNKTFF